MTGQHEGVIALSTRKTVPPQPEPAPVNTHPGPDFALLQRVRDGLKRQPAESSSDEGSEAA